jgi:hexokinase
MIDEKSARPGQQTYEKMIAGLYLGEIFRQVLVDVYGKSLIFQGQDVTMLSKTYSLDSGFLSAMEEYASIPP